MAVELREVKTKADIKQFAILPFEIYKGNTYWVPPVVADEMKALNPQYNPAFEFCKTKFLLAYKDGKCVGRIGAIINEKYNEKVNEKLVRFSRLEAVDDAEVFKTLINAAEAFGREQGMTKVHGPLGFTNLDTQGLLIEGFDYLPSIASVYHLPYYKKHIEALGYEKENDWVEFRLTLTEHPVKKAARGAELLKRRYGFTVRSFTSKKELEIYGPKVFEVLNDAFAELPYVISFDDKMSSLYSSKYFKVLNPRYTFVVEKDDELVGFLIGLPSLSEAMQKAKGRLFPFGFLHLLKALKHPKVIDLMLTGVLHKYHSSGAAVLLFAELQKTMLEDGIETMETTGIFETNTNVITNWKNFENIQHKRRRCFVKAL